MWTKLNETSNSTLYKYNNTIEKVVYCKETYEKEINALKMLSHPNIISIEKIYLKSFTMKYYRRGDMFYYIKTGMPEYVVRHYAKQLIEALIHCHTMGVSHRDVKPENLLLTYDWNIKLCDFGLSSTKRIENNYGGTTEYACPEVLDHIPHNPMLADTWSYGVTVYAILMGSLPWESWCGSNKAKVFLEICLKKKRPYLYKLGNRKWLKYGEVEAYMSKIEINDF